MLPDLGIRSGLPAAACGPAAARRGDRHCPLAHAGQVNKLGVGYIEHPLAVM